MVFLFSFKREKIIKEKFEVQEEIVNRILIHRKLWFERETRALPFLPPLFPEELRIQRISFHAARKRGSKGVGSSKGISGIVGKSSNITDVGQQADWNRGLDEARLRPNCQVAVCNWTLCSSLWRVHDSHSSSALHVPRWKKKNNLPSIVRSYRATSSCFQKFTDKTDFFSEKLLYK